MAEYRTQFALSLITPEENSRERGDVVGAVDRFNSVVGKILGSSVRVCPFETLSNEPPETVADKEREEATEPDFTFIVIRSFDREPTAAYVSKLCGAVLGFNDKNHSYVAYSVDRPLGQRESHVALLDSIEELEEQLPKDWPIWTYEEPGELANFVILHLTRFVSEKMCWDRAHRLSISLLRQTAPTPDVKVKVAMAVACPDAKHRIPCVSVTVENHSPQNMFIERVFIKTHGGSKLVIKHDFLTGEPYEKKRILPGDNVKYTLSVRAILEMRIPVENMVAIVAEDAIGREYPSPNLDFVRIVNTDVS